MYAPPTGGFDDFRQWQIELDTSRPALSEPRLPHHPSRAALRRDADSQIAEGVADWLRTHSKGA
ncbi:hypothetical protein GCM10010109_66970 [Actinoplanes campanulatus]|nr:hypothetical protein GCM10010109_66970 [Actinoplanes campanulatus]GID40212.1 hypothetical protein Aca09nite_67180 [Actinoplanes campanulatus]